MATNPPKGPGRKGAIKDRDQVYNPKIKRYIKRDENKQFMDQMERKNKPFKGVRKVK
jgi:hypothetical protein